MAISSSVVLDRAAFAEELAIDAHRTGSATFIQGLLDAAKAKQSGGGGEIVFLTAATGNNKSGTRELRMDCVELFTLASKALTRYAQLVASGYSAAEMVEVPCTFASFGNLSC